MSEFSAPSNGVSPSPCDAARSGGAGDRPFPPQSMWKDLIEAAAPFTPLEWLGREIERLTAAMPDQPVALQAIAEALSIAGDGSNRHAVAVAAERLSELRLPDRPRRNAGLLVAAGGVGHV